jgi:hypothetical protein
MIEKDEYSIDELLSMLENPNNKDENSLSAREIWDMIANRESHEKMGFSSESEMKDWILENPYSDL